MCITSERATLSNTTVAVWELTQGRKTPEHVLGYQNRMQSRADLPNSMLLHIPAVPGSLARSNFIDTTNSPDVLKEMRRALPAPFNPMATRGGTRGGFGSFDVFDVGKYTVVLTEDVSTIPDALKQVNPSRRPEVRDELLKFYGDNFPGWAMAIACFNNREMQESNPILVRYQPADPSRLHGPGLDSHTGLAPDLDEKVRVDHTLVFATDKYPQYKEAELAAADDIINGIRAERGSLSRIHDFVRFAVNPIDGDIDPSEQVTIPGYPVRYSNRSLDLRDILPERVVGVRDMRANIPNGDFEITTEAVRRGVYMKFDIQRTAPSRESQYLATQTYLG